MAVPKQITLFVFILVISKIDQCFSKEKGAENIENEEQLVQSESKDGKLEIIKRIKKINDDGSYTIGYEADDGSFKIESRDVLGHIKGTYGFVDDQGQIKRVSYSTSNSSEIISKPELPSVVQRIPVKNKTITSTKRPTYIFSSTITTPITTANSVVQSITKRRTSSTTTSTSRPNYDRVVNVNKATARPSYVTYTSAAPRVLLQGRSTFVDTTETTHIHPIKSEGQLLRPEIVTVKSTDPSSFRQLTFKHLEDEKPVNEDPEPEIGGNILRRQSPLPRKDDQFNIQEHVFRLQQSLGQDSTDVYSNSMTTGTPRPLYTTTNRPLVLSTTPISASAPRPTTSYIPYYNNLPDVKQQTPEYAETTTLQTSSVRSTSTPIPVVQIPANKEDTQEPLIAIRRPYERHAILVPLSHIQSRFVPNPYQRQYRYPSEQYLKETTPKPVVEVEQQQAIVRRLPPPPLRPIPVQVDENGYIRDVPRQIAAPYPVAVTPPPRYIDEEDNNIDDIQPPVSTKDLQKLLQQLILRQSRLEKISALTRNPDIYQQQQQQTNPVYTRPEPYFVQRLPVTERNPNGPIQFVQRISDSRPPLNQQVTLRQLPQQIYDEQYEQQSYRPNRRVARLLPIQQEQQEESEQYLPSDVREMLLLRMLQLAINPSMPLKDDDLDLDPNSQIVKRMPVRNVEILGEEATEESSRMLVREKRYIADVDH